MNAKDIMTANVITVTPDTAVEDIAKVLLENKISGLPVVDAKGNLVGMVSEGDLMRRPETDGEPHRSWWLNLLTSEEDKAKEFVHTHGRRAEDVMTADVAAVTEDTPVHDVAEILEKRQIKRVPVVRDGKVVGIISRANLLHGLAATQRRTEPTVKVDDHALRQKVIDLIEDKGWVSHGSLNPIVTEGVVELWGWVDSKAERKAMLIAVEEIDGVKRVEDHLGTVAPWMRNV
jgi:CBS domain-containing protein